MKRQRRHRGNQRNGFKRAITSFAGDGKVKEECCVWGRERARFTPPHANTHSRPSVSLERAVSEMRERRQT